MTAVYIVIVYVYHNSVSYSINFIFSKFTPCGWCGFLIISFSWCSPFDFGGCSMHCQTDLHSHVILLSNLGGATHKGCFVILTFHSSISPMGLAWWEQSLSFVVPTR